LLGRIGFGGLRDAGNGYEWGVSHSDAEPEITVTEAIARLRRDGFVEDFSAHGGALLCGSCRCSMDPGSVTVDVVYRFEGESDPDDEAAVFGLTCVECGAKGVYVVAYGPSMGADDAAVVAKLASAPRTGDRTP
jgi:hypothetical protein